MSSVSAVPSVTGLVEALRAELVNSARQEKTTQRRQLLDFTSQLDRVTDARAEERNRIRLLDEVLASAGLPTASDVSGAILGTPTTSGAAAIAGTTSGGIPFTGHVPSQLAVSSGSMTNPALVDSTDSALLRLLSANPTLESSIATETSLFSSPDAVSTSKAVLSEALEIAKSQAEKVSAAVVSPPLAIPVAGPSASAFVQSAVAANGAVSAAVSVSPQGGASSNQDALLAKYGIGQRATNLRGLPPGQRNRRSTELDVEAFE